jgi:hypothetical protein
VVCWQFAEFAEQVVAALEAEGHWADFIDPCSGLPVRAKIVMSSFAVMFRICFAVMAGVWIERYLMHHFSQ